MAQRLQVARALAHRPDVLFLDEPTAGLDPQSRIALWDVLGDLHAHGTTVVLTTHNMDEADRLCHRVAIIDHGEILVVGTPGGLKQGVRAETVVRLTLARDRERAVAQLSRLSGVDRAETLDGQVLVHVENRADTLPEVLATAARFQMTDLSVAEPTLETVFIELTGRALRD